jgi:hypothetical protein
MGTTLDYLHGGSFDDADGADTIAAEIRSALIAVRTAAGITQPLPTKENAQQMNILFAAIGRGVLNHLAKHPKAFQVNVNDGVTSIDGYTTEIDVQN